MPAVVKPFLKWVGGKQKVLDQLLPYFPKGETQILRNYHEPFLGGGSVLLSVLERIQSGETRITGRVYASDLNPSLIGLYKNIQSAPEALIEEVRAIVRDFERCANTGVNRNASTLEEALTSRESFYFWTRTRFNAMTPEERTQPPGSAMLLFMNKTGWRGLYREGPHGLNVPYGNYKNPSVLDESHIRRVSALIRDVIFSVASFEDSISRVEAGDFVYLDPPYAPETDTSFVGYTYDKFSRETHERLFELCRSHIRGRGARFMMSNADVKLVKDAFPEPDYTTKNIVCRRSINSTNPEATTREVVITH